MKSFYIAFLVAVLAMSLVKADIKSDLKKLQKVCTEQSKATPEELNTYFGKGMQKQDATDAVKCHLKCMMEQNGYLKNGAIDQEYVLKIFEVIPALQDHMKGIAAAVEVCKNAKGVNACDTAFKITDCFINTKSGKLAIASY
uniref:Odorant binding protein n=1 Tax=Stomoxys calcitrans TaxID=35570 RepID=A0A1I8P702_STOCA